MFGRKKQKQAMPMEAIENMANKLMKDITEAHERASSRKEQELGLLKKIKDFRNPPKEDILQKHGVLDEDGDVTHLGFHILVDLLFEENRAKIVKLLEEVEKA